MAFAPRFRDLMKKYGKVAIGVHFSVSAASITGLYVAIKNNVDVASVLERAGLPGVSKDEGSASSPAPAEDPSDGVAVVLDDGVAPTAPAAEPPKKRNRTAELAASSGGALALAVLCNKALFPVRVPITIALTPPIARFMARRNLIKAI
uniref:Protein FAM210A n=1 Tax=Anthurium amnicola TaxID=1678845 RepID=A0A1D1YDA7_9ARAE